MNNRILSGTLAVVLGTVSLASQADQGRRYGYDSPDTDYARVVRVEPLLERVRYTVPVEQCWTEERSRPSYRSNSTGAALLGGAMGAILGNSVGHGDGRRAATFGGAVLGAAVGNQLARNDRDGYREERIEQVQRCSTRNEERYDERVAGYRVTYDYNGRRQVTQLPYDPGRYLKVAVDVHPLR